MQLRILSGVHAWLAPLVVVAGCSSIEVAHQQALVDGTCHYRFESSAVRGGDRGEAQLYYACESDACGGDEHFAVGAAHTISIELATQPGTYVGIESSDSAVASLRDVTIDYDPCAENTKIWATLDAHTTGTLRLELSDDQGNPLDAIELEVTAVSSIVLRATTLSEFAFELPDPALLVTPGESLIVSPELYDITGTLVIGTPEMSWQTDDPSIASVRTVPEDDEESFVHAQVAPGAAFVDIRTVGYTAVRVQTLDGAEGALPLQAATP